MRFQDLSFVSIPELTGAFNEAFSGYFVPLQLTEEAMEVKLRSEGIDLQYSIGAFDGDRLCGFILHGVDTRHGHTAVYNAGTGVVRAYRGKGLTQQLYQAVLSRLTREGMIHHQLEVIDQNAPAIRAYEKVGFTRTRSLSCFKGTAEGQPDPVLTFEEITAPDLDTYSPYWSFIPTWQNDTPSVGRALDAHKVIELRKDGELLAYAIYAPASGRVKQYAVHPAHRRKGYGRQLFTYLCSLNDNQLLTLINVDESDAASMNFFNTLGFQRFLRLWEMTYTAGR
jgi:ribosomal protein S18 acetylase RimI-like enzyme